MYVTGIDFLQTIIDLFSTFLPSDINKSPNVKI